MVSDEKVSAKFWKNKHVRKFGPAAWYAMGPIVFQTVYVLFHESKGWILAGLIVWAAWIPISYYVGQAVEKKWGTSDPYEASDWAAATVHALSIPVERRAERITRLVTNLGGHTFRSEDLFHALMQPEEQLNSIVTALYGVFSSTSENPRHCNPRVVLVALQEQNRHREMQFVTCYPSRQPRSSTRELLDPSSCIMKAAERSHTIVIEDVGVELMKPLNHRRFVVTSSEVTEGSIVCYAIRDRSLSQLGRLLVISIYSPRPGAFKEARAEIYEQILTVFSQMIVEEYCFYLLKQGMTTNDPIGGGQNNDDKQ